MSNDGIVATVVIVALSVALLVSGGQRSDALKRATNAELALSNTKADLAMERRLRAADQAAVASTTKQLKALKAQKGKQDVQLKAALVAERQWADAAVPDSVRAALRVRHATND